MEAQMVPEGQLFYHTLQSQKMKRMDSKKPVRNLSEKIHSLLGFKEQLTSNWVSAVRNIIKSLPSEGSPVDLEPPSLPQNDSTDAIDVDLGTSISKIKDELAALTLHINQLNIQRRQVLNDLLDLKGNIRVFCRIRPISVGENFGCLRPVVALGSSNVLLKLADHKSKSYSFDKVFHPGSSQDEVFSEVEPVIKSALDGYNACIFAYGQTGTGKTFTMEGTPDFPGVVPRAIEALFNQAVDSNHAFLFSFSMLEIYRGNLRDLLVPQPTKITDPMPPCLSIQTDPKGGIEIENLVAIQVSDFNQVLRLYRLGCRFRSTASTNSNTTSSRSHCMIRISITCFNAPERRRETNKVWLVDLGGSERVLKTKASGKRLEEGKAINLSLSALGDVINALQRTKGHIPYRNSKLTQVLKDSLGEDSKTLMLVHVSPKEDDLCETVCSLNFAARARSIHLGRMDSTEIREQKNFTMMNLQQNLKIIEDERQDVRSNIQKLNQKLEDLTRTTSSSSEKLEEFHYSNDVPHYNPKNKNEDVKSAPSSQLPRFMRPTVCSRRKSGTAYPISGEKNPVSSRRRPASQCAASVTFPVKVYSEYTTASTISRTSCLTSLNKKCTADNETEYSQEASECDIKTVVSVEQETSRSTCHPNTRLGRTEKFCRSTNKYNSNKFHKVDNWLHLQKIPPTLSMHKTDKSKRILAVPAPEKKHVCNQGEKVYKLCSEKVCEPTMKEVVNHDMVEIPEARASGSSESEVMIDKPQTLLKEFFDKASKPNFISPWHATECEITVQNQELADGQSIQKNKHGTFSQTIVCSIHNEDNNQVPRTYTVQEDESQCSEGFAPYDNKCHHTSPSDLLIIDHLKGNFGLSVTNPELVSCCQQPPSDISTEDGVKEDMNDCSQSLAKETRPRLKKLRSQRALFTDHPNEESMPMTFVEGNIQNTGIRYLLKEKIQILSGSVLLGLGFQSLGFNHDFYHGLLR